MTDTGLEDFVPVVTPFAKEAIARDGVNGIIRVKGQVAMLSVLPIHYDDGSGTPNGALAEIRLLGPAWVERLRESLNLDIVLRDLAEVAPGPLAPQSHSAVGGAAPFTAIAISDKVMNLHLPLADLHGTKIGYWDVTLERKINFQGIQARLVFYFVLFVLIIAAAGVIGGLLRWMVIARLEALELAVRRVGVTSDLSSRLPLSGSDELTSLTDGINKMLQALADANERRVAAEHARKQLTSQLQEAQKLEAIRTLAAGLAHDFNNLITSIQGSATLIRLELDPVTDTEIHLERIEQASRRAAGLVQKMTAFGRRSPTIFEDIHLKAVIEDALNLVRPSVPRGIAFEFRNNALSDLVHADAGQLQQAIVNLATNASHAMADGTGTLTVELSTVLLPDDSRPETRNLPAGPFLRLVVRDVGCGISPAGLGRVFEPFYTTKPVGSGTGLGLAVVHGIVGNHRGTIGIASELGRGTSIFIHLPIVDRSTAVPTEPIVAAAVIDRSVKLRVLLVDDDDLVRAALTAGLKRMGYHVETADSGATALGVVNATAENFDVLIIDQMMPGMTGIELGERIGLIRPAMRRILISGYAAGWNEPKVKALGFAAMIMKPITMAHLNSVLKAVCSSKETTGVVHDNLS